MANRTGIEWTDATWNPVVGCSIISPGCKGCYAMRQAHDLVRRFKSAKYEGLTEVVNGHPVWTGEVRLHEDSLEWPLGIKKPKRIFVNSMSDLFHEKLPDSAIDKVFAIMALAPQHTFQVLTKRPDLMLGYLKRRPTSAQWAFAACEIMQKLHPEFNADQIAALVDAREPSRFPLPNVMLGVSVEDQKRSDERRLIMLDVSTMGWKVFVSYEPAIGPVEWPAWYFIDWLISGGESGPEARPSHPDWHREARDHCANLGTPFFFKQWGEWQPYIDRDVEDPDWQRPYTNYKWPQYRILNLAGGHGFHGERVHVVERCGKKRAGSMLDGREHKEFPHA